MSRDRQEDLFAEHLRGAFEAECPAPEVFLEAEWVRLPAAERDRIEAHAATCPKCAAERDLAGLWDLPFDVGDVADEDLAFVVGRIEEAEADQAPPARSNVVPFPLGRTVAAAGSVDVSPRGSARRPARSFPAWGLALAALLALGIGLLVELRQRDLPALPGATDGAETYRGSTLLLQGPDGELAKAPEMLGWEPVTDAASYRVSIVDPLGEEIWKFEAKASPVVLPVAVRVRLQTAVVYAWTVEALDARGKRLARAEPLRFRIAPR
ncbi:MAG TPA: hypothetical protein VGS22_02515 [Thermoanaerobaculia bacterium]|jgi:hypothetical protein|nr:hypothetical protein [Thermoanaerobaculia bacterium]